MIIQCRKCETRYRFEDKLMEGDGVWVRCSRCQHVFFEENALTEKQSAPSEPAREVPSVRISEARRIPDDRFDVNAELTPSRAVVAGESYAGPAVDRMPEALSAVEEPVIERVDRTLAAEAGGPGDTMARMDGDDEDEDEEGSAVGGASGRSWGGRILKLLLLVILVALLALSVALWLFPEVRNEALEWASPGLKNLPGFEKVLPQPPASRDTVMAPVRLKDVRQRTVANLLAGNLQVIEGIAVNQAPYPLARIRVRLAISDAYDVLLGERIVYAGNLLTDAELGALAEAEIQRELSIPQGTDRPNDKIAPNGEIPFMIVFSQEQAGAIKTVVTPLGGDRLP